MTADNTRSTEEERIQAEIDAAWAEHQAQQQATHNEDGWAR